MQDDTNGILACLQRFRDIGTITLEAVVCLQYQCIVDIDAGDGVEIVDIKIPVAADIIEREAARQLPILFGDPLHDLFIAREIGIGDKPFRIQGRVDITGQRHGERMIAIGRRQPPQTGEIDGEIIIERRRHRTSRTAVRRRRQGRLLAWIKF